MGELGRKRRERDIRISKGHIQAVALSMVLFGIITFFAGYRLGSAQAPVASSPPPAASLDDVELVELLARLEASGRQGGGVEDLTYPDALRGGNDGRDDQEEEVEPEPSESAETPPQEAPTEQPPAEEEPIEPPPGDPPPSGAFTLELAGASPEDLFELRDALRERELPAWVQVSVVGGDLEKRLGIGGYEAQDEAFMAMARYSAELEDLGIDVQVAEID